MSTQTVKQLYILDFGLFQVHQNRRIIGIPGYLIQTYDDINILVDTGFPATYAEDSAKASLADGLESFGQVLKLDDSNLPTGQLGLMGLTPSDIDILVMTHTDIDHVGGLADFPHATLVIDQVERALDQPRYFANRSPIEWPVDVTYQIIDQDTMLCPGVELIRAPGHAPGQLSLLVRLPQTGPVLLTGDAISRPAELEEGFGGAWDEKLAQRSGERLMDIAKKEQAMIIYGHDPVQWDTLRKAPEFYG